MAPAGKGVALPITYTAPAGVGLAPTPEAPGTVVAAGVVVVVVVVFVVEVDEPVPDVLVEPLAELSGVTVGVGVDVAEVPDVPEELFEGFDEEFRW